MALIIFASAPLIFSGLGRTRNATGFNGILSHPNLLGVFLGIALAAMIAHALASHRIERWKLITISLGLIELYLTEARGGMFSLLLALVVWGGCLFTRFSGRSARVVGRGIILIAIATPVIIASSSTVQESVSYFVSKSGRTSESGLVANFRKSRGGAIAYHMRSLRRNVAFGRGFQVINSRSDALPEVTYDPIWKKIPISASVENGFLYTSIFVELGLIGSIPVFLFFAILIGPVFRRRDDPANVLLIAVLFTNVTEAAFFSPSGVGAWEWQMIALYMASHQFADFSAASQDCESDLALAEPAAA
ncbi:hypothetical protein FYK55_26040 [Roseiconus nitratireducens]|uniref:O-antigen ligase-like membrane protein n=1 Tax=Roseiconus nitratireducens TaxID=2605748 RepID=A0A5M6CUN0_9BACT|nr:hypothetical protein [Roseiconus nitratireducens]KAA5538901.1 hypothetical protein FYK55_26040 [Roseiconus nitratireducens]